MSDELDDKTPQVDYNLKGKLIQVIGDALSEGASLFTYDPRKSFVKLKSIRILIAHRLSDEERNSLKNQELILERQLTIPYTIEKMRISYGGHLIDKPEAQELAKELILLKKKANLESYFEELMSYLNKYGFLLGEKQDEETTGYN